MAETGSNGRSRAGRFAKGNKIGIGKGEVRNPKGFGAVKEKRDRDQLYRDALLAEIERQGGKPLREIAANVVAIARAKLRRNKMGWLSPTPGEITQASRFIADRLDGLPRQHHELAGHVRIVEEILLDPSPCTPERRTARLAGRGVMPAPESNGHPLEVDPEAL